MMAVGLLRQHMQVSLNAEPQAADIGSPSGVQTAWTRCAAKIISNENQSGIREGILIAVAARKPSSG
jgi:hypothetical protein